MLYKINPRLRDKDEGLFGVVTTRPWIFAIQLSILMNLVLEGRYGSPLSIDTKNVPVIFHFIMTLETGKTGIYGFSLKIGQT